MNQRLVRFLKSYFWILCILVGGIISFVIMFILPHKIYIDTILEPTIKIIAFIIVILGIAFIPNKGKPSRFGYLVILIALFSFLVYIIPRISYYGFIGIPKNEANCYDTFYTYLWLYLYPAIICTTCFAYRIAGGEPDKCIKIALIPIIGLFSGLLDLVWWPVNGLEIPDVLQANHIRIIIGHWPSKTEAIIFALCHIPLAVIVLFVPLNKWFLKFESQFLKAEKLTVKG